MPAVAARLVAAALMACVPTRTPLPCATATAACMAARESCVAQARKDSRNFCHSLRQGGCSPSACSIIGRLLGGATQGGTRGLTITPKPYPSPTHAVSP